MNKFSLEFAANTYKVYSKKITDNLYIKFALGSNVASSSQIIVFSIPNNLEYDINQYERITYCICVDEHFDMLINEGVSGSIAGAYSFIEIKEKFPNIVDSILEAEVNRNYFKCEIKDKYMFFHGTYNDIVKITELLQSVYTNTSLQEVPCKCCKTTLYKNESPCWKCGAIDSAK